MHEGAKAEIKRLLFSSFRFLSLLFRRVHLLLPSLSQGMHKARECCSREKGRNREEVIDSEMGIRSSRQSLITGVCFTVCIFPFLFLSFHYLSLVAQKEKKATHTRLTSLRMSLAGFIAG